MYSRVCMSMVVVVGVVGVGRRKKERRGEEEEEEARCVRVLSRCVCLPRVVSQEGKKKKRHSDILTHLLFARALFCGIFRFLCLRRYTM